MLRHTSLVILRLTRDCNLNCKYCFMTNKADFKGETINPEVVKQVVKDIKLYYTEDKPPINIVFHGGEPTLIGYDYLKTILSYMEEELADIPHSFSMQTNGTLLDDKILGLLQEYDVNVGLTYDDPERGIKKTLFNRKIELLNNYNLAYSFIIISGKNNIDDYQNMKKDILKTTSSYKVNYLEDFHTELETDGYEFFNKIYKPEIDEFIKTGKIYENRLLEILISYYEDTSKWKTGCGSMFCGAGINMIGINPDGTSHYCDRYDREYRETFVRNILDYDFLGLTQYKRAVDYNIERHKVVLEQGCDKCRARKICDGGCMAFYYSKHHKWGIDEKLVCNLYLPLYDYIKEHEQKIKERLNEMQQMR